MKRILPEFEYSTQQNNFIKELAVACNLTEDLVKILYARGVDTPEKIKTFLTPGSSHFIDPYRMSGMEQAVRLISRAKDEEWVVVVYGDYDADGVCASTIMSSVLRDFGIEPIVFIPERKTGYGLSIANIDAIFEEYFPQLFITVDCGISNAEEVEYIKEQGAEVIVTDHHELPERTPDCICVNPKFSDDYPYDNLCGAGVAFKVGCALNGESAYDYLDFAAIATVADSVPLLGENRDIVAEGLKRINRAPRPCYTSFLNKSESDVTAQTLAFSVAPKINAAGRMGDASAAVKLFSSQDETEVYDLSVLLTSYNSQRQKYCDELYVSAKEKLQKIGAYGKVIMLWDDSWNTGFVGIVAAKLAEEFGRPALLFVRNGDMLKGSARSIDSVNIFEALRSCSDCIEEFGGHSQAAGVNISVENFAVLEQKLNDYLSANYPPEAFVPTLYVCETLNKPSSARFIKELELLEPFGVGNRRPLFALNVGAVEARPGKQGSSHLTIRGEAIDFMYFNGISRQRLLQSAVPKKLIFEYNVSRFRGKEYVKGFVRDVVYQGNAIARAQEAVVINNLNQCQLSVPCQTEYKTKAEIMALLRDEHETYGTICLASSYQTLNNYNLQGFGVEVFTLSSRNLANTVLISPQADVDLSGFKTVVYLDEPTNIAVSSLQGKKIVVCSDVSGRGWTKSLNPDRKALLDVFAFLTTHVQSLEGSSAEELATAYDMGSSIPQALFALKVFEQLSLISFADGKFVVYRGVKTELSRSQLYRLVQGEMDV